MTWFNQDYLVKMLKEGERVSLRGTVKHVPRGGVQLLPKGRPEPAIDTLSQALQDTDIRMLIPIYPLTGGVTNDWFRDKVKRFLPLLESVMDPLPPTLRAAHELLELPVALRELHAPSTADLLRAAQRRLGFEELLVIQLGSLQLKHAWRGRGGGAPAYPLVKESIQGFVASLPFKLTNAQRKAAYEILQDLERPLPMLRLLEGDVGSGKTIVAALGIFSVISQHGQAAVLAPTEILARQHAAGLTKLFAPLGKNVQLLVGSTPEKQRREIISGLAQGTINLLIGTHALLEDDVRFHALGLAIVDEQHRFGVKQRALLRRDGTPHLLAMTATPIPRTLALTIFGEQDLSILDELPPGRTPIRTKVVTSRERPAATRFMEEQVKAGRQVFVICPLIDDSPSLEAKSVTTEYERLKEVLPHLRIALLHGRMKPKEKDDVMGSFNRGDTDVLVSTAVVEVGIDVPNATVMAIEGAERFGLAQLHQFRGRVGRGAHASYCLLFTSSGVDATAVERLKAMEREQSGFALAELDLRLRGPGEVFGTRQSGIPDLKMASLFDAPLIHEARAAAESLLDTDPTLTKSPALAELVRKSLEERGVD